MEYRNQRYVAVKSSDCDTCALFKECENGEATLIQGRESCLGNHRADGEHIVWRLVKEGEICIKSKKNSFGLIMEKFKSVLTYTKKKFQKVINQDY